MALDTQYRVVAVAVPRSESVAGRILLILDASAGQWFKVVELAARLRMDPEDVRSGLSDLRVRGLAIGKPTAERNGKQPIWIYQIAEDLSAYVPADRAGKAAA